MAAASNKTQWVLDVRDDPDITWKGLIVGLILGTHMNNSAVTCWLSIRTLVRECRHGKTTIHAGIAELEQVGLLQHDRGNSKGTANFYYGLERQGSPRGGLRVVPGGNQGSPPHEPGWSPGRTPTISDNYIKNYKQQPVDKSTLNSQQPQRGCPTCGGTAWQQTNLREDPTPCPTCNPDKHTGNDYQTLPAATWLVQQTLHNQHHTSSP
jgi:hypothetical protein